MNKCIFSNCVGLCDQCIDCQQTQEPMEQIAHKFSRIFSCDIKECESNFLGIICNGNEHTKCLKNF